MRVASLDANALVQARLRGARIDGVRIDIETAVAFAAAHGLVIE